MAPLQDTADGRGAGHHGHYAHPVRPPGPARTAPAALPGAGRLCLTVGEAAALLGISRALAYELAARGELPVLRLGRRLVVPRQALLALVGLAGGDGRCSR